MTTPKESNEQMVVHRIIKIARWLPMVCLVIGVWWMSRPVSEPPPKFGQVPSFSLTDQTGTAYGSKALLGNVWVANFIFTRCKTVCPVFSGKMADLQKRTKEMPSNVRLVSFSVDPDYDTSEVLSVYSQRFSAIPGHWYFLTGPIKNVRAVVVEGMSTFMEDAAAVENPEELMHGSHFVLVDHSLQIRGYYAVDEEDTVERLLTDIQMVMKEKPDSF